MHTQQIAARGRHFVVAGMPRAGTTYLYHAFATHPDAFVPYRKELRFFSTNFHRGPGWYLDFFSGAAANLLLVDASPDYFMDPNAPARIREFSPHLKVVLAVRDPAAWAVSLHRQLAILERTVPEFREFLSAAEYPDFAFSWGSRKPKLRFSLQQGFVQAQLAAFREALGSRLLLFDFAFFEREPLTVMRALESFLEIRAVFSADNLPGGRINARARKSNRLMSYLSSRDSLINTAGSVLPRKLLVALRIKVDQASRVESVAGPSEPDAIDLAMARDALARDRIYVDSLFARSPMLLGDGQSFR